MQYILKFKEYFAFIILYSNIIIINNVRTSLMNS